MFFKKNNKNFYYLYLYIRKSPTIVRLLQSSCRHFRHLRMVQYVGNLLLAIASSISYEPIDVGSAYGIINLAI